MRLSSFKRLNDADYDKDDRSLVSRLANSLNDGIDNLYLALSNRISLRDNIQCTIKDVDIIVNSSGIPTLSAVIKLDRQGGTQTQVDAKILGLSLLDHRSLSGFPAYPTSGITISWTQVQTGIQIDHVTGLIPGNPYRLRVVCWN